MPRHNRADLNGLEVWMLVQNADGTPTLTRATGSNPQDSDISFTDTGAGNTTVTINPFRGPKGEAYAIATPVTISLSATITSMTYTGDSLAIVVRVEDDASAATDSNFYLHVYAE